jgi:glycosyltransferase involved in cell wall biosynthesis
MLPLPLAPLLREPNFSAGDGTSVPVDVAGADRVIAAAGARDRRLSVLFLTHYFPPEGNAPASRVHEMCKRWVRDGHEVTVVTCVPNNPTGVVYPGYRNKPYQTETVDGIRVVRVWTFVAANKGKIRRTLNFVSYLGTATLAGLLQKRPDVVIATSPQFFCGWAGTILSALRRLPFLLEIRDIWPESIAAVGAVKKRFLLRALETMERLMYRSATHVVTVGDGYRTQLARRGVDPSCVSVVTNGVDQELFTGNARGDEVRARHDLKDQFVCSYVGTLGMACALSVVVRAAKRLKDKGRNDIKFMLVGDGAVRAKLEQEVAAAGLDNVIITGRVDKPQVPSYLAAADACLVHLRKQELFRTVLPSKMFEASGMGKPIVLGVEGCAADFVRNAGAGIAIEPESDEALAAAVERLADDRALCARLGRSGQDYVRRHFDRDKLSHDYVGVIRQTLDAHQQPKAAVACA